MAIEKKASLFVNDPTKVPGLEKNDLYLKLGYGYYAGVPWTAGHSKGTLIVSYLSACSTVDNSTPWGIYLVLCIY